MNPDFDQSGTSNAHFARKVVQLLHDPSGEIHVDALNGFFKINEFAMHSLQTKHPKLHDLDTYPQESRKISLVYRMSLAFQTAES